MTRKTPTKKTKQKPSCDPDGLTPRQRRFVHEYVKTLNASKAAIAAGYSKNRASPTGSYLVANRKVKVVIDRELAATVRRSNITRETLIERLMKLVDSPVAKPPTHSDRVRALELIARMHGYLVDKHEIGGPGGVAPVQLYLPDNGRNPRPPQAQPQSPAGGDGREDGAP